ncbi:MAG: dual specificity protein phosphatase family protein [Myxococcales bacterium]
MAEFEGLNLSWVHDRMAIGGAFAMSSVPRLAQAGVRHVVDLRDRTTDDIAVMLAHGIDFLHLPTPDRDSILKPALLRGVQWVVPRIQRGEPVLLHCEHGMGRSVLLGLCVLVRLGIQPTDAMLQLKQARPSASPSPRQIEAFIEWSAQEQRRTPSWDDLARIAYSSALSLPSNLLERAQA